MLDIVVDLIGAQTGSAARGIGRYALGLAGALMAVGGPHVAVYAHPSRPTTNIPQSWPHAGAPDDGRWRLVTSPFEFGAKFELPVGGQARLAAVAYDVIPLLWPDRYLALPGERAHYQRQLERLERAYHLLAISEATRADFVAHTLVSPERITVIGGGLTPLAPGGGLPQGLRQGPFALAVSSLEPHKNTDGLIRAWAQYMARSRPEGAPTSLVITGSAPDNLVRAHARLAHQLGVTYSVDFRPRVTDAQLAALYRACAVFVSSSRCEGLGLPILEAMAAGAVCIVAANSAQPEVAGAAAIVVDAESPRALADALAEAATPAVARRLRAAAPARLEHYRWEDVARRTLEALV